MKSLGGILLICQNATAQVCVEHALEYIMFYVQKHTAHFGGLFWIPAG